MGWLERAHGRRFNPARLFRPQSLALIGAEDAEGALLAQNIQAGGFAGPVQILESTALARLETADLVIVAAWRDDLDRLFAALAERDCRACLFTALRPGLTAPARQHGVRVMGPGSFGIANTAIGLNATLGHLPPPKGRIALVSQSAALCRAVIDWAGPNGVGFSHVVGIGGNADIGFGMTLDWLSRDPEAGLIMLDIRRLKDSRAFIAAARAAGRLRPMLAIRAGGRLLDEANPAAEGPAAEAVFEAALRRAGILAVAGFEDFLAAAETLSRAPPLLRDALLIVTDAVTPAQFAADEAMRRGIPLAALADEERRNWSQPLPAELFPRPEGAHDPLYTGFRRHDRLLAALADLMPRLDCGGALLVIAPTGETEDERFAAELAALGRELRRPLLIAVPGETTAAPFRQRLAARGLPVFTTPEQAVHGFQHLLRQRHIRLAARELPPKTVVSVQPDRTAVAEVFARVRGEGRRDLFQDEALAVIEAYGIPVVPSRVARNVAEAEAAAIGLGYPVVLKWRRTEKRGAPSVALDIRDREGLAAAIERMRRHPAAQGEGAFLVQRQVARARELAIALADDPLFGPVFALGLGGAAGGVWRERAYDLPPLNLALAQALIARAPFASWLEAFHEWPPANREALAETLVRLSQLIVDFPEIAAFRLDPLFVDAEGVLAGDASFALRPAGERARFAILPYPAELEKTVMRGGETFIIRPIRPEDAEAHGAFFSRLAPEDIRYRFFTPLRTLTQEQMARLTQVDYQREIAFIAQRPATGETVGVARLVREEMDGPEAEFAIVLEPSVKHKGLGRVLMEEIFAWAKSQGITEIVGQVLADNAPMIGFVRRLGFTLRRLPGEEDVLEARLTLAPPAEGRDEAEPDKVGQGAGQGVGQESGAG
jgi:acetyltransferase